ncbi:MAG TPA: AMP-binding protein [Polyangiaceae bacterium]|nr:AMP-binding protein [Polyangiaceae bacterium]
MSESIQSHFLALCREHGLFMAAMDERLDVDLIESGEIDSIGLVTIQHVIGEYYRVRISEELFVTSLRTLNQVIAYLERALTPELKASLTPPSGGEIPTLWNVLLQEQATLGKPPGWHFPEENLTTDTLEIRSASLRYAGALHESGVGPGDRVGIMLDNCSEYIYVLLGLWALGATAVPLRPHAGLRFDMREYLERIDRVCELAAVIFNDDADAGLTNLFIAQGRPALTRSGLRQLAASSRPIFPRSSVNEAEIALIQYSSGSTDHPKGIIVTQRMVMHQVQQLDAAHRLAGASAGARVNASWLPFHHDMGLFMGILFPLFTRTRNILVSPRYYMIKPKRWFSLLAEQAVELNFTTNLAMASSLNALEQLEPGSIDLSRLYLCFGAEKVAPDLLRKCAEVLGRQGLPVEQIKVGYGMAENGLGAASTRLGSAKLLMITVLDEQNVALASPETAGAIEIVSLGEPQPFTTISVRSESGAKLPDLTIGEICVEGPSVTPGYYRDPETTARNISDGMLRTRDLGFTHAGELYFYSRKDDLLIVGGVNIAPDDIEHSAERVAGVAVGGTVLIDVPSPSIGKADLVLLVEVSKGSARQDLEAHKVEIQARILKERGLLVNRIVFALKNAIEKTSSGKKRRRVIRERFLKQELALL